SGIRVVKAYRAERHEARVFTQTAHELLRLVFKTMRGVSGVGAMTSLLVGVASVTGLLFGGRGGIARPRTAGDLFAFTLYLGVFVAPMVQIVQIGTQLSEAFAGLERMREIMGEKREDDGDRDKAPLKHIEGNLEVRDVWFEYAKDVPVLKGIN